MCVRTCRHGDGGNPKSSQLPPLLELAAVVVAGAGNKSGRVQKQEREREQED